MKNSNIQKFYVLLISVTFFFASANAQIVYINVNPDSVIHMFPGNYQFHFDMNNDGISDFRLKTSASGCSFSASWYKVSITPLGINNIADSVFITGLGYPKALNANTFIGNTLLTWKNDSNQVLRSYKYCPPITSSGLWPTSSTDKYLAVNFFVGSNIYYGWIRLNLSITGNAGTWKCTIKDYAYNSIPNQLIRAGETSCTTPTVTLTASGSLSFCTGDSVTLTANGTGYQYQWKKGGANISGATHQTYVAKIAGIYKCKVTNSCGIKTSGGKTVTVSCKLENEIIIDITEHLTIYPNPATNYFTVKIPTDDEGEISVSNLFGQIIYSEKVSTEQTQIDVTQFPSGIYFIRWSSGENNETKMFSVVK